MITLPKYIKQTQMYVDNFYQNNNAFKYLDCVF